LGVVLIESGRDRIHTDVPRSVKSITSDTVPHGTSFGLGCRACPGSGNTGWKSRIPIKKNRFRIVASPYFAAPAPPEKRDVSAPIEMRQSLGVVLGAQCVVLGSEKHSIAGTESSAILVAEADVEVRDILFRTDIDLTLSLIALPYRGELELLREVEPRLRVHPFVKVFPRTNN